MKQLVSKAAHRVQRLCRELDPINIKIANSMKGRMVCVQTDGDHTAYGIVANVLRERGTPKIVVDGARYDLGQVLTVTPVGLF